VIFAHVLIKLFDDHQLADLLVPGADLHAFNAKRVYGTYLKWERYGHRVDEFPDSAFKSDDYPELKALRQDIKAVWYGLMYGKSAYGFATSLRDKDGEPIGQEIAEKIVAALYEALPAIPRYQIYILEYIQRHWGIPGLGGAWCDLSELIKTGNKWDLARAHRIAQNYPMQEGGARIIGHSMVEILSDPACREAGLKLERQVHDELDFRVPSENVGTVLPRIKAHMTSYPLESLLQVSIGSGPTWEDC
jgi:DNA polymerase-1